MNHKMSWKLPVGMHVQLYKLCVPLFLAGAFGIVCFKRGLTVCLVCTKRRRCEGSNMYPLQLCLVLQGTKGGAGGWGKEGGRAGRHGLLAGMRRTRGGNTHSEGGCIWIWQYAVCRHRLLQ